MSFRRLCTACCVFALLIGCGPDPGPSSSEGSVGGPPPSSDPYVDYWNDEGPPQPHRHDKCETAICNDTCANGHCDDPLSDIRHPGDPIEITGLKLEQSSGPRP